MTPLFLEPDWEQLAEAGTWGDDYDDDEEEDCA